MSREQYIQVNALIKDEYRSLAENIVDAVERAGMLSPNLLRTIGVISGVTRPDDIPAISSVEGIAAVEPGREVGI